MKITCPVCDKHLFSAVNSLETCPTCGWKNDQYQTEHIFVRNGANKFSLAQSRKAYRIMNLGPEIGYGSDNLLWGITPCKICDKKICVDECQHKIHQILNGETPTGAENLESAKKTCARCIIGEHKSVADMRQYSKMTEKLSGRDTYGNGAWGFGSDEYDLEYYQRVLKSLIKFCHDEAEQEKNNPKQERKIPDFDANTEYLMQMMAEDDTPRRNYTSYFYTPLLPISDFIDYVNSVHHRPLDRGDLWAYGESALDEKYKFTPSEKHDAEQALHMSLSFLNYKCDSYGNDGLYYLDNAYQNWDPDEFDDLIATWFADIGDELDESAIREFIEETLSESFSYSHVKLVLHMLGYLGYDKNNFKLQNLLKIYALVPALKPLVDKI